MFTVWNIHRDGIHALFFLLEATQMTTDTTREFSLAVAAMIGLSTAMLVTPVAVAADKAANKATGTYVTGDFHNHTTCSDGSLSLRKLVDKSYRHAIDGRLPLSLDIDGLQGDIV